MSGTRSSLSSLTLFDATGTPTTLRSPLCLRRSTFALAGSGYSLIHAGGSGNGVFHSQGLARDASRNCLGLATVQPRRGARLPHRLDREGMQLEPALVIQGLQVNCSIMHCSVLYAFRDQLFPYHSIPVVRPHVY